MLNIFNKLLEINTHYIVRDFAAFFVASPVCKLVLISYEHVVQYVSIKPLCTTS